MAFSHTKLSNNRSVMPLDVRGCTRATMNKTACRIPWPKGLGNPLKFIRDWDRDLESSLERGIPSKCESSVRVDYVPALCTHRPSLLPIEWFSEISRLATPCREARCRRELAQT